MSASGGIIQATITGPIPAGTNLIGLVNTVKNPVSCLTMTSAAHTTNGSNSLANMGLVKNIAVDIDVTALSGPNTSIQFFIERIGLDGVSYIIWQSPVVTTALEISTSIGTGLAINQNPGTSVLFAWVVSGGTPSVTFSASVQGD